MKIYLKRLGLGVSVLGLVMFMGVSCSKQPAVQNENANANPTNNGVNVNIVSNDVLENSVTEQPVENNTNGQETAVVKEFTMTSFYELVNGQPKPQFSLKEITVKKGDKVRINVTNTKGTHDFNIDEYNIHQATPADQQVIIEFVADKAGEFVYYCNTPNHRVLGHWGTLIVE